MTDTHRILLARPEHVAALPEIERAAEDIYPELSATVQSEIQRGFDPKLRVAMMKRLS